jgi:hypothetical protein
MKITDMPAYEWNVINKARVGRALGANLNCAKSETNEILV